MDAGALARQLPGGFRNALGQSLLFAEGDLDAIIDAWLDGQSQ